MQIPADKIQNPITVSSNSKMQSSLFWPTIIITNTTKLVVSGFIKNYSSESIWKKTKTTVSKYFTKNTKKANAIFIPEDILRICWMYYDCYLELPIDRVTPFTIFFAMFDLWSALSVKGWISLDNQTQWQYLTLSKIDTSDKCITLINDLMERVYDFSDIELTLQSKIKNDIMHGLTSYRQVLTLLMHMRKDAENWYDFEVSISFMHHLLEQGHFHSDTWKFAEYFRRYCKETKYDGYKCYNDILYQVTPYGAWLRRNICCLYRLESEPFSTVDEILRTWSKQVLRAKSDHYQSDSLSSLLGGEVQNFDDSDSDDYVNGYWKHKKTIKKKSKQQQTTKDKYRSKQKQKIQEEDSFDVNPHVRQTLENEEVVIFNPSELDEIIELSDI